MQISAASDHRIYEVCICECSSDLCSDPDRRRVHIQIGPRPELGGGRRGCKSSSDNRLDFRDINLGFLSFLRTLPSRRSVLTENDASYDITNNMDSGWW